LKVAKAFLQVMMTYCFRGGGRASQMLLSQMVGEEEMDQDGGSDAKGTEVVE
jgi:hypothetical protein